MLIEEIIERAESGWFVDDDLPNPPCIEWSPLDSAQARRFHKAIIAESQALAADARQAG